MKLRTPRSTGISSLHDKVNVIKAYGHNPWSSEVCPSYGSRTLTTSVRSLFTQQHILHIICTLIAFLLRRISALVYAIFREFLNVSFNTSKWRQHQLILKLQVFYAESTLYDKSSCIYIVVYIKIQGGPKVGIQYIAGVLKIFGPRHTISLCEIQRHIPNVEGTMPALQSRKINWPTSKIRNVSEFFR